MNTFMSLNMRSWDVFSLFGWSIKLHWNFKIIKNNKNLIKMNISQLKHIINCIWLKKMQKCHPKKLQKNWLKYKVYIECYVVFASCKSRAFFIYYWIAISIREAEQTSLQMLLSVVIGRNLKKKYEKYDKNIFIQQQAQKTHFSHWFPLCLQPVKNKNKKRRAWKKVSVQCDDDGGVYWICVCVALCERRRKRRIRRRFFFHVSRRHRCIHSTVSHFFFVSHLME